MSGSIKHLQGRSYLSNENYKNTMKKNLINYIKELAKHGKIGDDLVITLYPKEKQMFRLNCICALGGSGYRKYLISRTYFDHPITNQKLVVDNCYSFGFDEKITRVNIIVDEVE